jgi:hypothetical protein
MAERELWLGNLDEAARLAQEVGVLGRELRVQYADPIYVALTAKIYEGQGKFDDAVALWEPWVDRIRLVGFRFGMAHALARGGRTEEAEQQWSLGAAGEFDDIDRGPHWLETVGFAAEVAYFLRDAKRGRILRRQLAPYTGHVICSGVGFVSTTEHALGVAALAAGDLEDAVEQLTASACVGESIGAPLLQASSLLRLGEALVARGANGDAVEARRQLDRALVIAETHHADGLSREASALLETP